MLWVCVHLLHMEGENLLAQTVSTRPGQTVKFTTRQLFFFSHPRHSQGKDIILPDCEVVAQGQKHRRARRSHFTH